MREVLARDIEMTGFNIAGILNEDVGTIGSYLNSMAKDGLVSRMGLRLQYNGKTRTKHMMWKLNHKRIRELEKNESQVEVVGTLGAMLKVPRNKRAGKLSDHKVQDSV
jgi:hypothetical protein